MSVKASVSLTETQEAYARELVAQGRFSSLSAVLQQGLELLREQSQTTDALRELLNQRRNGTFHSTEEASKRAAGMINRKRVERGL